MAKGLPNKGLLTNWGDEDAYLQNALTALDAGYVEAVQNYEEHDVRRLVALLRKQYAVVGDFLNQRSRRNMSTDDDCMLSREMTLAARRLFRVKRSSILSGLPQPYGFILNRHSLNLYWMRRPFRKVGHPMFIHLLRERVITMFTMVL